MKPLQAVETYTGKIEQADPSRYREVPIDTEDYANVLLRLNNGARGSFTVSQVHAGRKNRVYIEIAGTKQSAYFDSEHPNDLWIGKRDGSNAIIMKDPSLLHPEARRYADYPGGHNEGYPDTFKQLFKHIYESVQSKRSSVDSSEVALSYPSFADGLREQTLCEAIVRSHSGNQWVSI
jgi:predicted dehydrogenase